LKYRSMLQVPKYIVNSRMDAGGRATLGAKAEKLLKVNSEIPL